MYAGLLTMDLGPIIGLFLLHTYRCWYRLQTKLQTKIAVKVMKYYKMIRYGSYSQQWILKILHFHKKGILVG